MEFNDINIEDKTIIEKYLNKANLGISEHCFTDIFMWQDHYKTKFYEDGEFLYVKSIDKQSGKHIFMCPVGDGDLNKAIEKLQVNFGSDIIIVSITDEMKDHIASIMPEKFDFFENRDSADYIYLSERLISLSGKKLHSKRNFVNRFISEYDGVWQYEKLTLENKNKAWEFHLKWHKDSENDEENESLLAETKAIKRILDNFTELCVIGGLIYVNDEVVAFTIATKSADDMVVIQIEKGDVEISGVYPMINKTFAENELFDIKYINREEDLGIEGLRKAKLSYKPEILRMKYYAKFRGCND